MSTYGQDRSKIYKYLEGKGLTIDPVTHAELKALLIEYVNHQNKSLLDEAKAWRNHQPKCEIFKARAMARKNRINTNPAIVKPVHINMAQSQSQKVTVNVTKPVK